MMSKHIRRPAPSTHVFALAVLTPILMRDAVAQTKDRPRLETNESYVEEVLRPSTLAVGDIMAVVGYVFDSLPDRGKVFPTENYYYFSFFHSGVRYAGNFRLDASNRDQGKLIFAYYADAQTRDEVPVKHVILDGSRGVRVTKLEPLVYRVSYRGKSVDFALNDLSNVEPPATALAPNETFLGPIFDESAIRFFLLYNSKLKIFHYVL